MYNSVWKVMPSDICQSSDQKASFLPKFCILPFVSVLRLSELLFTEILALTCWAQESTFPLSYHNNF